MAVGSPRMEFGTHHPSDISRAYLGRLEVVHQRGPRSWARGIILGTVPTAAQWCGSRSPSAHANSRSSSFGYEALR